MEERAWRGRLRPGPQRSQPPSLIPTAIPPRGQGSSHLHTDLHGPKALWSFPRRDFPWQPTGQQIYKPADRRWGVGGRQRGRSAWWTEQHSGQECPDPETFLSSETLCQPLTSLTRRPKSANSFHENGHEEGDGSI